MSTHAKDKKDKVTAIMLRKPNRKLLKAEVYRRNRRREIERVIERGSKRDGCTQKHKANGRG